MGPLMTALGWALLNFIWQGVIVGAGAALLLGALRRSSPRWRYGVCALALFVSLCLPVMQLLLLSGSADAVASGELPEGLQALQAQLPALVSAWSLGVGVMGLRLGLGLVWVARMRRRAGAAGALWQARLDRLSARMGLRRQVRLLLLAELAGPITVGFWRPVVLLPAALLTGMPGPLLEALLAHELAHVRRWDYLANLLQSLVEALLFFHPVIWWLSGRMRNEREQVADELAAAALGDRRQLARALHELSLRTPAAAQTPLVLSARGGTLFQRIERLIAPHPQTSGWKLAMPALLLASASLLVHAQSPLTVTTTATARSASGTVTMAPASSPLLRVPVNARHALVLEEGTGRVVMAKDADAVVPIASLTKLMTAMVVLDARLDPAEMLKIDRDDVDVLKHSASRLKVGAEMSRLDALKLTLMASENRAAAALARTFPGGIKGFETAMQAKIRSLGLTHTALADPTGLSPSNTSTATEVAKIATAAARYPEIQRITSDSRTEVPVSGRLREVHNTDRLVGNKGWDIQLSKTGYTEEAGRCLTLRMKSGERNFTVVLLAEDGSAQRLRDAMKIRQSLAKLPV